MVKPKVLVEPPLPLAKSVFKLPSLKVTLVTLFAKGFIVEKLFVQVSVDWSIAVRLLTVKSLLLPDTSSPKAELS